MIPKKHTSFHRFLLFNACFYNVHVTFAFDCVCTQSHTYTSWTVGIPRWSHPHSTDTVCLNFIDWFIFLHWLFVKFLKASAVFIENASKSNIRSEAVSLEGINKYSTVYCLCIIIIVVSSQGPDLLLNCAHLLFHHQLPTDSRDVSFTPSSFTNPQQSQQLWSGPTNTCKRTSEQTLVHLLHSWR